MIKSQILFLDSGVGGLTLLHKAIKRYPREQYIFYTDSANMPYGDLSKKEVLDFIQSNIDEIKIVKFDALDVQRHPLVSKIIEAYKKNSLDV